MCATRTTCLMERTPATCPSSRTGRWRKRCPRKISSALATESATSSVNGLRVITSATLVLAGSMRCPTERSRSRSLTMPVSLPSASSTAAAPTLCSSSTLLASASVMSSRTTTAGLCIRSETDRASVTDPVYP